MFAAGAFVVAVGLASCKSPPPRVVAEEIARTPKGTATVLFYTDFQCPHCRRLHALLAPLLAERGARLRVVLRHVPLPRHPDARAAARASVCAETLTPTPMAFSAALFSSEDLGDAAIAALASQHGIPHDAFASCLVDRSTDARIDRDVAEFDALGGDGVPLFWIGRQRYEGVPSRAVLEAALDEAIKEAR